MHTIQTPVQYKRTFYYPGLINDKQYHAVYRLALNIMSVGQITSMLLFENFSVYDEVLYAVVVPLPPSSYTRVHRMDVYRRIGLYVVHCTSMYVVVRHTLYVTNHLFTYRASLISTFITLKSRL